MADESRIEARVFSKVAWRLVPMIAISYLIALIDRNNLSFASVSMNIDLGFSHTVYGLGVAAFYCGYSIFEVPSNLLLARFGARRWLARIMFTWGLVSMAMALVHAPWQFYLIRFLLGVAEAGFFPGVAHYLSDWIPARRRGSAISLFYVASPISGMVTGALAQPLLGLHGTAGLTGWQWLFLIEGLPALAIAALLLVLLPDAPARVGWLTPKEKTWLTEQLDRDAMASGPAHHSLWRALSDPVVLLAGLVAFLNFGTQGAVLFSGPAMMVSRVHGTMVDAGRLSIATGALTIPAMLIVGQIADRASNPFALKAALLCVAAAGVLVARLGGDSELLLICGYLPFYIGGQTTGLLMSVLVSRFVHPSGRAAGIAMANTLGQLGAFVGPILWGVAADATGSYDLGLSVSVATTLAAAGFALLGGVVALARTRRVSETLAAA